jgi:hypothetical protein
MDKKKRWIIVAVIILFLLLLLLFHGCFRVDITRKPSTKSLIYTVLDKLGLLSEKVDKIATDVDTLKVDVRDLKGRKHPRVIYRTVNIVQPAQSSPSVTRDVQQPQQTQQPQQLLAPEPPKETPVAGSIVAGPIPGPQDLLFCIDLEPNKVGDSSKKFLFWELCNNLGYNISNVVPNATGKPANMRLSPGGSADGIMFDGEILKISVASLNNWYSQIFGVPMPDNFRPGLRSNKSGWQTKIMSKSGDYFVYRF